MSLKINRTAFSPLEFEYLEKKKLVSGNKKQPSKQFTIPKGSPAISPGLQQTHASPSRQEPLYAVTFEEKQALMLEFFDQA